MALSNLDRVNKGLDFLRDGLHPFLIREMKEVYGDKWEIEAVNSFPSGHHSQKLDPQDWDVQALLHIITKQWNNVFSKTLGFSERAMVSELMEIRKRVAHQNNSNKFNTDDAYRALDNVERLLTAIAAPEAEEAEVQKSELLRIRFEESARKKAKKLETQLIEGQTSSGLIPWRQVLTPHPDVASGKYQQAEFAADLWRVYQDGANAGEYGKPIDFFNRTYLTKGIRKLLINAIKRLNGNGGDPVINLQTNFGGGKTHSLLALYHLCSGAEFSSVRDLEDFFNEAGDGRPPKKVNKAVLVGNRISPGTTHPKDDGTVVHTLWGEMAWQLGGKQAYDIVRQADENGSSPGDQLEVLFKHTAPCLILIDEWVAYVRQLNDSGTQVCGTYGAHMSFAQALCEAAKRVDNALVVLSLPESDIEMGGEKGRQAAAELRHIVGRIESPWSAATTAESFEIVTRRLFTSLTTQEQFSKRDTIARAFGDFYRQNTKEFPSDAGSADYEKSIRDFYPIHPELFERLAEDWASIDKFQKTRGILRLMAKIIHFLWESGDQSPLIMPANVPMDDSEIQEEIMRYLDEPWRAVIYSDVDGSNSLPRQIDNDYPNLGRYSATRRVARTMFFGSAPTYNAASKGVDEQNIKLGSILPGESIPVFSDALRHLTDKATYVYYQDKNYWYSTQNNVNRTAEERAVRISEDRVEEEISNRVSQQLLGNKGQLSRVHLMPQTSNDVPDDMDMKLVVLGTKHYHVSKDLESSAYKKAKEILSQKGSSQRLYRNSLLFLAPDKARLDELKQSVRQYLAWKSIQSDKVSLNLDAYQNSQVDAKVSAAKSTFELRLPETFIWLLTPYQELGNSDVEWDESKLNGSPQDPLSTRVAKKLISQSLLYNDLSASELRINLDKVPLWRGDFVQCRMLKEDFAKYLYLPKLTTSDLLKVAVESGLNLISWSKDSFAYADAFDEESSRFRGLRSGQFVSVSLDGTSLLVKPNVALEQLEKERAEAEAQKKKDEQEKPPYDGPVDGDEPNIEDPITEHKKIKKTRFFGHKELDAIRFFRDAENVEKEILKHLITLKDANVKVTIHIQADSPTGFTQDIERTLKENSNTLEFDSVEFE